MNNPYETLDVSRSASDEEIKKAYRDAAKKAHSDVTGGDDTRMRELNAAYALLSSPERRKAYDKTGDIDEDPTDKMIRATFFNMAEALMQAPPPIPIKITLAEIRHNVEMGHSKTISEIEANRAKLQRFKARIVKSPENDLLGGLIADKLKNLNDQKLAADKGYDIENKALAMIEEYVFRDESFSADFSSSLPMMSFFIQTL